MMIPILQLDQAGNPSAWLNHRQAISLMASERVIANLGEHEFCFLGGYNRISGIRSQVTVGSILLTNERVMPKRLAKNYSPPYSNRLLFQRDHYTCLYCGEHYSPHKLTRDHIIPRSRGGDDGFANSATACKACNHAKGNRTPEEWGHLLLEVPYVPNYAEFLYLTNPHRIIEDQLAFLQERFPKDSYLLLTS
jgi:hypothetical protein